LLKVEWAEDAIKDLQRLDKPVAKRIVSKISWFSHHFNNIIPFKFRIGDWRVIYTVEKEVIVIQAIGHRREIYKA